MEINPVGQWMRIEGYDKSTGGFGDIDLGISLPLSFWGKNRTTEFLAEPKLPNPQSSNSHPSLMWSEAIPWEALDLHDPWNSSKLFQWNRITERIKLHLWRSGFVDMTILLLWAICHNCSWANSFCIFHKAEALNVFPPMGVNCITSFFV